MNVNASSDVVRTCGSLIAQVVTGSATVVLGGGLTVIAVPQGGAVEVTEDASGGYTIANLSTDEDITVTVDGVVSTIEPGQTDTVQTWDFVGFLDRIQNAPTLNQMKAGAVVQLKWRVLDSEGSPVTNLASAAVRVSNLNCLTGEGAGQGEQTAVVGSGLQNLGSGYYQLNWKTAKSWASSCKILHLDIGDGVTHDAFFSFTK